MIEKSQISFKDALDSLHKTEPWLNVFLFKYITVPLSFVISKYTRMTPNHISIFAIVLLGYSAYSIAFSRDLILGSLLYLMVYILDAIDGKVARLTKNYTRYGAWFDIFVDRIVFVTMVLSYSFYYQNETIYLLSILMTGLFLIGFESRYNIQFDKLNKGLEIKSAASQANEYIASSDNFYSRFCKKYGLISQPISLVEIIIFNFVIAPLVDVYVYAQIVSILFFTVRIVTQQKYWIRVD